MFDSMSLRARFTLLVLAILVAGTAIGYGAFVWTSRPVIATLSGWFAERSALYEKSEIVRVLGREVVLAQKMANSTVLREWARNEADPILRDRAHAELESYRQIFSDGAYFVALAGSGHYYYGDGDNNRTALAPTYTLNTGVKKDAWFYLTLEYVQDYVLNVDTDRHLQTTKVWVNAVLRDDDRPLAVLGTGIDLTRFIERLVDKRPNGVVNILLDRDGAIQAHRDQSAIDFASIRRPVTGEARHTIYQLLAEPDQVAAVRMSMDRLLEGAETPVLKLTVDGNDYIAALTDLPELDWFLLTLTNPDQKTDASLLAVAAVLVLLTLGLGLMATAYAVDRGLLQPLAALDKAAHELAAGHYQPGSLPRGQAEFGRLANTFDAMARRIRDHTADLERQVSERTAELSRLAYRDPLTGMLNRRGLLQQLAMIRQRVKRQDSGIGLLLIDIDHFKRCNDTYGHDAGDRALVHLAGVLSDEVRSYDLCARWGGEEFLVVVETNATLPQLVGIGEKLRTAVLDRPLNDGEQIIHLTISVGACIVGRDETTEAALSRADNALYRAKAGGRNRVIAAAPANGDTVSGTIATGPRADT